MSSASLSLCVFVCRRKYFIHVRTYHVCRLAEINSETASFVADLFCHIARVGGHALAGHDMYHGHVFAGVDGIGMLIHAKEHPLEYVSPLWYLM